MTGIGPVDPHSGQFSNNPGNKPHQPKPPPEVDETIPETPKPETAAPPQEGAFEVEQQARESYGRAKVNIDNQPVEPEPAEGEPAPEGPDPGDDTAARMASATVATGALVAGELIAGGAAGTGAAAGAGVAAGAAAGTVLLPVLLGLGLLVLIGGVLWYVLAHRPADPAAAQPSQRPSAGASAPAAPAQQVPARPGHSVGDPHLLTFDGYSYDFQAVGEFVLTRSTADDFAVQTRYQPPTGLFGPNVSITTAVAIRTGGHRVAVYDAQRGVLVDGQPVTGQVAVGGATASASAEGLKLTLADGTVVTVTRGTYFMSTQIAPAPTRAGRLEGLLGDFDGALKNDLRPQGGTEPVSPDTRESLYDRYGDTWRITQQDSLFDYLSGESTEKFTDRTYPHQLSDAGMLTAQERADAEKICRAAGVLREDVLAGCVLDVATTKDPAFAADAAAHQSITVSAIELGQQQTAALKHRLAGAAYTVTGRAGQRIAVEIGAITPGTPGDKCGFDVDALLLGPDHAELWREWIGNGGCGKAFGPVTLPADGTYQLVFLGGLGQVIKAQTGTVEFRIVDVPDPTVAPLTLGTKATGKIESSFAADEWRFTAAAGQTLALDVSAITGDGDPGGCRLDLTARVYAPDGSELFKQWIGNGGCHAYPVTAPAAGTYRVVMTGGDGSVIHARTGTYTFAVLDVPAPDVRPLKPGTKVNGRIEAVLGSDEWRFTATAGQQLVLDVAAITGDGNPGGCGMDLTATVYGPDGAEVFDQWIGNGGCRKHTFTAPSAGTYRLVLSGGNGSVIHYRTGTYTLTITAP
ncbi:VWD domain-containing protein [Catellatospora sp. KI3]|uniref:VWD domain-containing protein n=1 Tax=Catellatospora sp. KI3 TaxID=3041620 RepID=UPI0024832BEF|nr:VWD domain-containing protein [Catellatospora sp. KI3]MDI1462784.1 VWD domain-containing protein [Catellatospora sp. KI3]